MNIGLLLLDHCSHMRTSPIHRLACSRLIVAFLLILIIPSRVILFHLLLLWWKQDEAMHHILLLLTKSAKRVNTLFEVVLVLVLAAPSISFFVIRIVYYKQILFIFSHFWKHLSYNYLNLLLLLARIVLP